MFGASGKVSKAVSGKPLVTFTSVTEVDSVAGNRWFNLADNGTDTIVAVGDVQATGAPTVSTSSDGTTWTPRTIADNGSVVRVEWISAVSLFVAVGSNGSNPAHIATSPDGITWTNRTSNTPNGTYLWDVIWYPNDSLIVACGHDGNASINSNTVPKVVTSPDGITWTQRTMSQGGIGNVGLTSLTLSSNNYIIGSGGYWAFIETQGGGYLTEDATSWGTPGTVGLSNNLNLDLTYDSINDVFYEASSGLGATILLKQQSANLPQSSGSVVVGSGFWGGSGTKGQITSSQNYLVAGNGGVWTANSDGENSFFGDSPSERPLNDFWQGARQVWDGQYYVVGYNFDSPDYVSKIYRLNQ